MGKLYQRRIQRGLFLSTLASAGKLLKTQGVMLTVNITGLTAVLPGDYMPVPKFMPLNNFCLIAGCVHGHSDPPVFTQTHYATAGLSVEDGVYGALTREL